MMLLSWVVEFTMKQLYWKKYEIGEWKKSGIFFSKILSMTHNDKEN